VDVVERLSLLGVIKMASASAAGITMLFMLSGCASPPHEAPGLTKTLDAMALFSETVYHARGSVFDEHRGVSARTMGRLRSPIHPLESALRKVGLYADFLRNGRIEDVVLGARHFRPPVGFGLFRFDACYAVLLSGPFEIDISARPEVQQAGEILGKQCGRVTASQGELNSDITFFIAQSGPREILVATDRDLLTSVLSRVLGEASRPDLETAFPGWAQLESRAEVRVVRTYRHDDAKLRVSEKQRLPSPGEVDASAVAMAMATDFQKGVTTLKYWTTDANDSTTQYLRKADRLPLRELQPGYFEALLVIRGWHDEETPDLLGLMGYLGFGWVT
jgi:hypothetical protein